MDLKPKIIAPAVGRPMTPNTKHSPSPLSFRWVLRGPLLTAAVVLVVEFVVHGLFRDATPTPFVIVAILYATLSDGLWSGLTSTLIGWLYLAYYFSTPGTPFQYQTENLDRIFLWALTMPIVVLIVNHLRNRLNREHEQLVQEIENHRQTEDKFRSLLEAAPDAMIVVETDGSMALINRQAELLFGYERADLLGKPVEMLIPESLRAPHPLHRMSYIQNPYPRPMGSGLELYGLHRDSHQFPVEISLSPIQTGEYTLISAVIRDITERKASDEALRESERQLRLLLENSPDIIYIMNLAERRATYLNRTEFLGYTRDEIESVDSLLHALHPDDMDRVIAHWREIIVEDVFNKSSRIEYRLRDKEGQWQWIQSRETVFISTPEGRPVQVLVTMTLITERKRAEQEQLELQLERERINILRQFVSAASHDLRTPLSIMTTSLYLLRKTPDEDKRAAHLTRLEQQLKFVNQQLENMFKLLKLDLGDVLFEFEACDLKTLLRELVDKNQTPVRRKNQQLELALEELPLLILADKVEFGLALQNLIENAIRYTAKEGRIRVTASAQDGQARVEIADTGVGVSAADLPHIFERFYRADKARGTDMGSSGLGLPIARKIIEAHQGTIEVESVLGKGTTFHLRLPLISKP